MESIDLMRYTEEDSGFAASTTAGTRIASVSRVAPFWANGVFAALLVVGTGGTASSASALTAVRDLGLARTGSACILECAPGSRRDDTEDAVAVSPEGLTATQHYLSLNLSDVAAVLRVSRPTVYAWLREESAPQSHNVTRMSVLFGLAKAWGSISPRPLGGFLKKPVTRGRSIFDLLCEGSIDRSAVMNAFALISRIVDRDQVGSMTAAEVAKQFGFQRPSKQSQEESIAQETGL